MKIAEYQTKVDEWIKKYGVRYFDEKTNALLLVEEVGELCRLIARKYGEQSFKKELSNEEIQSRIEDEMADIFFVLTCLSNQMNMDISKIIEANFSKKTQRDHSRHHNNDKL